MDDITTVIAIIEAECRSKLEGATTPQEMLKIAFRGAKNHWMFTNEGEQQRGAIGAAMLHMAPEDSATVGRELQVLSALNASASGVPVDLAQVDVPENVIGILKIYNEVRDE